MKAHHSLRFFMMMTGDREISTEEDLKTLYIIGGTMGVGKTSICQQLKQKLNNSVFLDGDWCWDSNPFQVTEETKEMVLRNITFLLNQFLSCSAYDNLIFCWVMHEQSIIDEIMNGIDTSGCSVKVISLICSEQTLIANLQKDIISGKRDMEIMSRSLSKLPLYDSLDTIKINVDGKSIENVAEEIMQL